MVLDITWSNSDIKSVVRVLNEDNQFITEKTKSLTSTFISIITTGGDLRAEYNHVVSVLLSMPDQLVYFIRKLTQARIMLSYSIVPEFKHVVNFYSSIVLAARQIC